nr:hypothetical protein [Gloeothece verrucosa]
MLNWLKKKQLTGSTNSETFESGANLRLIGDRSAGKTAYMASLAYWPNANSNSPVQSVTPFGDAGASLITMSQEILEQGLELPPTDLSANIDDVKDYGISIMLKKEFSLANPQKGISSKLLRLNINCKDYAGEFLADLIHKAGDTKLKDYLEDCVAATGILLLIDGTTERKDKQYANGLDKFLAALDQNDLAGQSRRIAFVMSKCEQPHLWVNRHQPKQLAQNRFPQVFQRLETWSLTGGGKVDYFNTSAFGMLGSRFPEPNAVKLKRDRDGTTSVIKDTKHWRPFGLVAPIYWLCTGQRHKELDKD